MPPQRYRSFCFAHDPKNAARRVAIAAAAGRASGVSRRTVPIGLDGLDLLSREGVASLLTQLLRAELRARIAPKRSRNLLRAVDRLLALRQ